MKKLWFRRKIYGWGWFPVTWQGWAILGVYVLFIFAMVLGLSASANPDQHVAKFIVFLIIATIILIAICLKTGERPHWQWGNDDKS